MTNRFLASISLLCILISLSSGIMYLSTDGYAPPNYSCNTGCDVISNPCGQPTAFSVEIDDPFCTIVLMDNADWSGVPLTITTKPGLLTPGTIMIQSNGQLHGLSLTYTSDVAIPLIFNRLDVVRAQLRLTNFEGITFDSSIVSLESNIPVELALQAPQLSLELKNTMWSHVSTSSVRWTGTGSEMGLVIVGGSAVDVSDRFFDGDLDRVSIDTATITTSSLCTSIVTLLSVAGSTITLTGESFVSVEPPPTQKLLPRNLEITTSTVTSPSAATFLRDANGSNTLIVTSSTFINVALYSRNLYAEIVTKLNVIGATFKSAPLWVSPTAPDVIISNNFFFALTPTPLVPLAIYRASSVVPYTVLSNNTYNVTSGYCQLLLNEATISASSDESIDSLCTSSGSTWLGNLSVSTSVGGDSASVLRFTDPASHLRLGQISFSASLDLTSATTSLTISNINQIVHSLSPTTATITGLPMYLAVYWDQPEAGSYIIVSDVAVGLPNPNAIQTAPNNWTASFQLQGSDLFMNVEVNCSICNSNNSTCTTPHTCICNQGWTGPTCHSQILPPSMPPPPTISPLVPNTPASTPIPVGCGPSPGPGFTCVNGEWITNSPVEGPTVVIPGNTGTVVINGDLNVTNVITFSGLNTQLVVNGCVIINGSVEIQLTEQEIQQLATESGGKGSKTKNLISVVGNNTCPGATNFQSVPISLNSPQTCTKVTSSNTSTKSSLSVLFTLDDGGCKKSRNIAAIVVPSVIGGIILLTATGILIGLYLKKKTANASKSRLSIGRA